MPPFAAVARLLAFAGLFGPVLLTAAAAAVVRVDSISPQGEVGDVRQVRVRFSAPVIPAGNPRAAAPYALVCDGKAPAGTARWANERNWVYDLNEPLAAGSNCTLSLRPEFQPLPGVTLDAPAESRFGTGAPVVLNTEPYAGAMIDEDQHFLLRVNGAVDLDSVRQHVWCEIEGLGDRVPVTVVEGAVREQLLKARGRSRPGGFTLLLGCARAFPQDVRVRLVWGAGVAAAANPQRVTQQEKRYTWTVRPRFTAEFSCERENAQAACLPLRPLVLRFSALVPRAQALAVRLQPPQGPALQPAVDRNVRSDTLREVRFAAPLAENTRYTLTVPAALRDADERPLANASLFPLAVVTAGLPPLAKFSGGPFGIIEASADPAQPSLLPLTLRQVQADLAGASTGGQVRIKRLDARVADLELLRWIARLRSDREDEYRTRALPMLAQEADATRADLPQLKPSAPSAPSVPSTPPAPTSSPSSPSPSSPSSTPPSEPRPTEVIGIPLPQRGYHVVEVESRILGDALLAAKGPMYARTGALVTNLGVHFKRGRSSSLVWVTTLDRGRPVAGARVAVNDCKGQPVWTGSTDARGIAAIPRGFDPLWGDEKGCLSSEGWFVTARSGPAGSEDLAFVFSHWNRGIEPWRFNLPHGEGTEPDRRAHTVFDRTLFRAGETVSMKHFLRVQTERGLALPPADQLPQTLRITHLNSGAEVRLPLAWPRGGRSAESQWAIPKNAALGSYGVSLEGQGRILASGSFRVEAFRVPLVDARLTGPAGLQVAPAEVKFSAQLNALAGGPMAQAPLKLSALLRRQGLFFKGYEDFSFEPPGQTREADEDEATPQQLVADKLPASTDAQGAARYTVAPLPALKGPSELLAELSFQDPNGETQTVSQRLPLWPAAVVAGLRLPGWAAARGQVRATAVVLSTEGRPLKDRALVVVGRLHQTFSTRKRIVGGFYSYDNRRETRELGTLCSGRSDAQGRLDCDLHLDGSGEVELIVRADDAAGHRSEAASTLWLAGGGELWFAQGNDDRIDILPEQRELQPGDTARLQVRMPFRAATALVTVEREGVLDSRVVSLTARDPVIEVPIPKRSRAPQAAGDGASWAPNVVVSVLVLRGRLREAPWWSAFTWGWRDPGAWWQAFRQRAATGRRPPPSSTWPSRPSSSA